MSVDLGPESVGFRQHFHLAHKNTLIVYTEHNLTVSLRLERDSVIRVVYELSEDISYFFNKRT